MSYGLPEQPRRRGGLGKLILPAIIFLGALIFFRSMSSPREEPITPQDRVGQGGLISPERSAQDAKYKIMEGLFETDRRVESTGKPMPSGQSQSSANGKWSMEEVDGGRTSTSDPTPQSKKTTKGQWSMEEVDSEAEKPKRRFEFSGQ